MRGLFLLFVVMPIIEMMVLFEVGSRIGAMYTIGLVLLTAVIGINILKQQGFSTLTRAQQRLNNGELPAQELLEGFMLAIGGALLLTPGFVTDAIGFTLLMPFTRKALAAWMIRTGKIQALGSGAGGFSFTSFSARAGGWPPGSGSGKASGGSFYEGEFSREPPPAMPLDDPNRASSGDDAKK